MIIKQKFLHPIHRELRSSSFSFILFCVYVSLFLLRLYPSYGYYFRKLYVNIFRRAHVQLVIEHDSRHFISNASIHTYIFHAATITIHLQIKPKIWYFYPFLQRSHVDCMLDVGTKTFSLLLIFLPFEFYPCIF